MQKETGRQVFDEHSLLLLKVLLHFSSNYLVIKLTSISDIKIIIKVIRLEKFIDRKCRSMLVLSASDLSPGTNDEYQHRVFFWWLQMAFITV